MLVWKFFDKIQLHFCFAGQSKQWEEKSCFKIPSMRGYRLLTQVTKL